MPGVSRPSKKSMTGTSHSTEASNCPMIDLTQEEGEKSWSETKSSEVQAKDRHYNVRVFITFSLVDSEHFTAICTQCPSTDRLKEIMHMYQQVPLAHFDWDSIPPRWLFSVSYHDQLYAYLDKLHHVTIEPLPQRVLIDFRAEAASSLSLTAKRGDKNVSDNCTLEELIPGDVLNMLAPFQKSGVEFVLKGGGRCLLADDMGLGKTRTAVASAMAYQADWPVLIVTPSSARHHWYEEIKRVLVDTKVLTDRDLLVVESASQALTAPGKRRTLSKFVILSYSVVTKMEAKLRAAGFNVVICDECHYLKNSKAGRTKTLVPLLKGAKRALMISGTPALSRPIELFTQLNALDSVAWPDERAFGRRYCTSTGAAPTGTRGGGSNGSDLFRGARNCRELHTVLTSKTGLMIRRLKKDILLQLPHKVRHVVNVGILDPQKRAECAEMCSYITGLAGNNGSKGPPRKKRKGGTTAGAKDDDNNDQKLGVSTLKKENFSALLQLYSKSGLAKVDAVLERIGKHLDDPKSGKLLVFAHHAPVMDAIEAYIAQSGVELVRIDGQTQSVDRFANMRHFQTAPSCRVALLAITAAGIGITLTAANTVFFVEMFWTPGSLIQAEDRAHRLGQTSAVTVTYFLAKGTIDDILWPLLCRKVKTLGEIVEEDGGQAFEVHSSINAEETPPSPAKRKGGVTAGVNIKSEDPEDTTIDLTGIDTLVNDIAVRSLERSSAEGNAEGARGASAATELDEDLILDSDEEEGGAEPRGSKLGAGKSLKRGRVGANNAQRGVKAKETGKAASGPDEAVEQNDDEPTSLEDMRAVTDTVDAAQLEAEEMKNDKVGQLYAELYADCRGNEADPGSGSGSMRNSGAVKVVLTSLCDAERVYGQLRQHSALKIDNYTDLQERAIAFLEANLEVQAT